MKRNQKWVQNHFHFIFQASSGVGCDERVKYILLCFIVIWDSFSAWQSDLYDWQVMELLKGWILGHFIHIISWINRKKLLDYNTHSSSYNLHPSLLVPYASNLLRLRLVDSWLICLCRYMSSCLEKSHILGGGGESRTFNLSRRNEWELLLMARMACPCMPCPLWVLFVGCLYT